MREQLQWWAIRKGVWDTNWAVFMKFYWDVKFDDCLLSTWEGVEIGLQSYCEEWVLIAVGFVTTIGAIIKCGLFQSGSVLSDELWKIYTLVIFCRKWHWREKKMKREVAKY